MYTFLCMFHNFLLDFKWYVVECQIERWNLGKQLSNFQISLFLSFIRAELAFILGLS